MTLSRSLLALATVAALAIGSFSFTSAYSSGSDLTISNLNIASQTNSYTDFRITALNKGSSVSGKSWVGIYTGDTFRRACPVIALNPSQQSTTTCRFYFNTSSDRSATLKFFIDDLKEHQEINESNNVAYVNQQTRKISLPVAQQTQTVVRSTPTPTPVAQTQVVYVPQYVYQNSYQPIPVTHVGTPVYTPTANTTSSYYTQENFGEDIGQYVTCHFNEGGNTSKRCKLVSGKANVQTLFCTADLCRLKVYGPSNSKISLQGSCGGTKSTTLDGYNKNLYFSCPVTTTTTTTTTTITDGNPSPLLPIKKDNLLNLDGDADTNTSITFGDKYVISYNNATLSNDTLYVDEGDTLQLAITFEDIDTNLENYVYKRIPKNLRIVDVEFPESVECRTRNYSSFSTIFCRGQDEFTEIIYELQAINTGEADIYGKIRYTDDGDKVLDTGYIPVVVQ
jgi:hypothetical protein